MNQIALTHAIFDVLFGDEAQELFGFVGFLWLVKRSHAML
ncbi:protein of unknown function (plasmid) [Xenorhabdus nematophila AN6/1]|nr:protein of unknown function [Xenorhabdus nematophila AN6/1]